LCHPAPSAYQAVSPLAAVLLACFRSPYDAFHAPFPVPYNQDSPASSTRNCTPKLLEFGKFSCRFPGEPLEHGLSRAMLEGVMRHGEQQLP
jgi:hypothetical protein